MMLGRARKGYLPHSGALFCVMVGLILSFLMHRATLIEIDEIGSWGISKGGALVALKTSVLAQGQGPLYFILLSFWIQLFGDSVFALRSLTMVTFAGAITCLFYGFERLKINRGVVVGALLVFLFSWCSLNYSFIARPYALALLFVACAIFISAHPEITRFRKLLLAAVGAATFFTHYFFVLPLILSSALVTSYRASTRGLHDKELTSNDKIDGPRTPAERVVKDRIVTVILWEMIGALLATGTVAPFFINHLGSVSELRYLTLPVLESLIPALQSSPLAPIGLVTPLYLLFKREWSSKDAYVLGLFELIFSIGLILSLYVSSHILEGTFFVSRYFGITLPILLIFIVKIGNELASKRAVFAVGLFSLQIVWSLFGPLNLATPLIDGLSSAPFSNIQAVRPSSAQSLSLNNSSPYDIRGKYGGPDGQDSLTNESSQPIALNHKAQNLGEKGSSPDYYEAQYQRDIRAPEKLANCAVFISSGFIESVSLERMHNRLLQPFLRSPAEYFFRGEFDLLPKHFFHYKVATEYVNKIREKVYQKGCALLVPARDQGFSTQLWHSLESIPPSLRETELIVEPNREWLDSLVVRAPL